jgi:hypothetical protein
MVMRVAYVVIGKAGQADRHRHGQAYEMFFIHVTV